MKRQRETERIVGEDLVGLNDWELGERMEYERREEGVSSELEENKSRIPSRPQKKSMIQALMYKCRDRSTEVKLPAKNSIFPRPI